MYIMDQKQYLIKGHKINSNSFLKLANFSSLANALKANQNQNTLPHNRQRSLLY